MRDTPRLPVRRLTLCAAVVGLLVGPWDAVSAAADAADKVGEADVVPSRYVVQLDPGVVPVAVKLDHPAIGDFARDAVADFVTEEVEALGGEVDQDYGDLPYLIVDGVEPTELLEVTGVVRVVEEPVVERAISTALDQIYASDADLDGAIGGSRADGSGWAVAIIDDGIDRNHPFFMKAGASRVVAEACFTESFCSVGTGNASSREGSGAAAHHPGDYHGTHVAGIAAGNDPSDATGRRGVASGADIIAVQVFNVTGSARLGDIDQALQWVKNKVGTIPVASVNLSLGGGFYFPGTCDNTYSTTKARVDELLAVGVPVVVAAGNEYQTNLLPYPACLSNVIVVGAVDSGDQIASFSNISPQVASRGVLAPGKSISSSVPFYEDESGYKQLDGTSMATPFVAGSIALLRQAKPTAPLAELQSAVTTSATLINDTRNFPITYEDPDTGERVTEWVRGSVTGMRRLDVWKAIGSLLPNQGEITAVVKDSGANPVAALPAEVMTVSVTNGGESNSSALVSASTGRIRFRYPVGTWNVTVSAFGFDPMGANQVSVVPGQVTDLGNISLARRTAVATISPTSSAISGGTTARITGRHLTGATSVNLGLTSIGAANVRVIDSANVEFDVPSGAVGVATVSVTTPIGTSTEFLPFTYFDPTPPPPPPPPDSGGGGGGGGGTPSPITQQVIAGSGGSAQVQVGFSFGAIRLNFGGITGSGSVTVTPKAGKPSFDAGGVVIPGYWLDITSSVSGFREVEVCAPIDLGNTAAFGLSVDQLRLFHWENNVRRDVTSRLDTVNNRVCGMVKSFSPFAVGALMTSRVAGVDRYETAARLSASSFLPGVAVAYVVTGEKFPDALAAGAAAGREGGPVLLTRLDSLPAVTVNELKRVAPKRVIVLGGTAVVSEAVLASIRTTLPGVPVERVSGADRFETAAKLSQRTFTATNGTVYVGSGLGFTEILAGAAAAGRDKSPLLLVPGTGPNAGLPASVATELKRLNPRTVVVLGGSNLVVAGVVDAIKRAVPNAGVSRIDGVDGYDTAAKISRTFATGSTVYVATGAVFADGLAGGAAAATRGHPMVMVPASGTLPASVAQALAQLRPSRVIVLGGTAAIARDIENAVARYMP